VGRGPQVENRWPIAYSSKKSSSLLDEIVRINILSFVYEPNYFTPVRS